MFIQTESTPNPATVKFLPGSDISPERNFDFQSVKDAKHSPLAQRLFTLPGVEGVFLGRDFVSVSKSEDTDWEALKPIVLAALMEHISTGQEILGEGAFDAVQDQDLGDEISRQIAELIETRVRPAVMMDGGDIVFEEFSDGIVYLRMQGACSGCPSSTATLKAGIENMLRHFIPEVQEVRPVDDF